MEIQQKIVDEPIGFRFKTDLKRLAEGAYSWEDHLYEEARDVSRLGEETGADLDDATF